MFSMKPAVWSSCAGGWLWAWYCSSPRSACTSPVGEKPGSRAPRHSCCTARGRRRADCKHGVGGDSACIAMNCQRL